MAQGATHSQKRDGLTRPRRWGLPPHPDHSTGPVSSKDLPQLSVRLPHLEVEVGAQRAGAQVLTETDFDPRVQTIA